MATIEAISTFAAVVVSLSLALAAQMANKTRLKASVSTSIITHSTQKGKNKPTYDVANITNTGIMPLSIPFSFFHWRAPFKRSGRISRCGDTLARTLLYEAAVVMLSRVKRASRLKDWARAIAKRSGNGKARVALARKLSVILHSVWRSGEPFRWSEHARAA